MEYPGLSSTVSLRTGKLLSRMFRIPITMPECASPPRKGTVPALRSITTSYTLGLGKMRVPSSVTSTSDCDLSTMMVKSGVWEVMLGSETGDSS